MSKKIYINEQQEKMFINSLLKEETYQINPSQVLIIKDFLDKNFKRGNIEEFGGANAGENRGMINYKPIVGMLDVNGEIKKTMTAKQLYELLFDRFQGMISDKEQRQKFLVQVIKDWYNNKITKDGMLSVISL